jgi:Uma2 family endonuclease
LAELDYDFRQAETMAQVLDLKHQSTLTYEQFLAAADEDLPAEWVNGEVIPVSPASIRHQTIAAFLLKVLGTYAEAHRLGLVLAAPIQMKTGPTLPGREPDLLFVAQAHQDRLRRTHIDGPADLVVEIVSPESRLRDRGEKMAEYEMGGVSEYWIVDPELERVDFYQLEVDGRYRRIDVEPGTSYNSRTLAGFRLEVTWLWQEPLPHLLAILPHLGLPAV